jgi:integrase
LETGFDLPNGELKRRAQGLLKDPDVKRWIGNLNSQGAKRIYLEALAKYTVRRGLTPLQIAGEFIEDRKEAENQLEDLIIQAREIYAPKVVNILLVGVKSWLKHNNVEILRRINVGNVRLTPTIDNERPPSQEELRRILTFADVRERASISLLAFSGLRPTTLASLTLGDLPELKVVDGKVLFDKVPTQIKVRAQFSKNARSYITFLIKEGCDYLKDYLEERISKGEALTERSPLMAPDPRAHFQNYTRKAVQRSVKRVFVHAGFPFRPYVLRSYFATAIDSAKIVFTHQQFFMGHTGPVEMVYTVNKRLSDQQVDEMRQEFVEIERHLTTIGAFGRISEEEEGRIRLKMALDDAQRRGLGREEILRLLDKRIESAKEPLTADDKVEFVNDAISKISERTGLIKEDPKAQVVIRPDQLEVYLKEGWAYLEELKDGRIIMIKEV